MTKDDINSVIFTVTQSIIALVVVVGGIDFLFQHPESPSLNIVGGFMGVVLTFYLSQAISNTNTNNMIKAQQSSGKLP